MTLRRHVLASFVALGLCAALGAPVATFAPGVDRRRVLADWVTAPENPFFATAAANRIWAHYFGRGLVEPPDDIRQELPFLPLLLR